MQIERRWLFAHNIYNWVGNFCCFVFIVVINRFRHRFQKGWSNKLWNHTCFVLSFLSLLLLNSWAYTVLYLSAHLGIVYFFIAINTYFLVMQYIYLVGSAIFTKHSIYRLTKFLVWKKHSYNNVVGYVMKKFSGRIARRFGQYPVVTFDVEIYFNDNQYASFRTKDQNNKKVAHIKQLLEEHHCHRNGRIKHKSRLHK